MRSPAGLLCLLACGCVTQKYALPMTAKQFVQYDNGSALVAYLGQPDASPSVCDLRSAGPHLSALTWEVQNALMEGLLRGAIAPAPWSRCLRALLNGLPEDRVAALWEAQVRLYWMLLRSSELEVDPAVADRAATLQRMFLGRGDGRSPHAKVFGPVLGELRDALEKNRLGPVARGFGRELVQTLELEDGRWQGREVTIAMMEELAAAGNERTLTRFAERLPSPELRTEAARRVVRIHIALSPFPEVRGAAAAVEQRVLARGYNSISLADHPLVRAWFDLEKTPIRAVLVRQDVWRQAATLLGYSVDRPTVSVLPELSLRGALWAEVGSISRPIGVCDRATRLDPTPCLELSDISLDTPFTYVDRNGSFHFNDVVDLASVIPLARADSFNLPVLIGGRAATTLHWQLTFERPQDLSFTGPAPGGNGPPLLVRIERPHPMHFLFTASTPTETFRAVVRASDLGSFHVDSAGARGAKGRAGAKGAAGAKGDACQDGRDGGEGGRGGDGGPGGNGGEVQVQIACGQGDCQDTLARVQQVVRSLAGAGGPGGHGGAGGPGGSGGPARAPTTHVDSNGTTVVDDPGCKEGSGGEKGPAGQNGAGGRPGVPGRVTFEPARG